MALNHRSGPDVVYGQVPTQGSYPAAGQGDNNPGMAPSVAFGGQNLLDIRVPYNPGQPRGTVIPGWIAGDYLLVDQVPSSAAVNAIASTQSATGGVALSLISASAQGIIPSVSITSATAGTVSSLLSIEGSVAMINYAPIAGSVQSYDPRTMLSRAITATNGSSISDSTTTYTVVGFDVYGYRMSEQITGSTGLSSAASTSVVTVNGKKSFKYIQSVTPSGVSLSTNVSIGTADIFGYPLTAYEFALTTTMWASATITGTGFTQPSTFTTFTSTTGDARGTYASSSASDSAKKLMMQVMVPPWAHTPSTSTPGVLSATGLTGTQA